jgi:hypothetical protein
MPAGIAEEILKAWKDGSIWVETLLLLDDKTAYTFFLNDRQWSNQECSEER